MSTATAAWPSMIACCLRSVEVATDIIEAFAFFTIFTCMFSDDVCFWRPRVWLFDFYSSFLIMEAIDGVRLSVGFDPLLLPFFDSLV